MTAGIPDPTPDASAIEVFSQTVFGHLDGFVPIRMFSEKGTEPRSPGILFRQTENLVSELQRLVPQAARQGKGLFVVPGTTRQSDTARAEDIVETGVLVIDLDNGNIAEVCDMLFQHLGPASLEVASGGFTEDDQQKRHLYWRLTEPVEGRDLERIRILRQQLATKAGGDPAFKSLHQPIRVPGSIHGKGGVSRPVTIVSKSKREYELGDLEEAITSLPMLIVPAGPSKPATSKFTPADLASTQIREGGIDGITRFEAISKIIGHWLRQARLGRLDLHGAWQAVSHHNAAMIVPPWDEEWLRREFDALVRKDEQSNGPFAPARAGKEVQTGSSASDDALADLFVRTHGTDWRHVAAWGKWLHWSGRRWRFDETDRVREVVRQSCRAAAAKAGGGDRADRISSHKTFAAVLKISAADPRIAAAPAEFDRQPMLLNTPAGIIDLTTGECLPHERQHLLTQITTTSPGVGCPRWNTFLAEITDCDEDLQRYLKRLCGYCLTGRTSEHVFAFFHGSGANGKSVFLSVLCHVLGDYAATAALGTFTTTRSDRHLTELAGLRAARIVAVPETEAGRAWNEARIKSVTGGEKIRANFMRKDHFEFLPQFKLLVAGNHRPPLQSVGEAMRRRLHLVPFEITVPPARRDRDLFDKLCAEAHGILGWMIDGCHEWQQKGLAPPDRIRAASDLYFRDEDIIGQWLEECCQTSPTCDSRSKDLYANWTKWAEDMGHAVGSAKSLGEELRNRGFKAGKVRGARGWRGLALKHPMTGDEDRT